ncbi:FABP family protein [Rhodococcus sp. MEB064]|uniref:FABP family protein n=1 Tax=Rhodococcus sp. MEB064 TaxID=1587522 RepID=UPI0005ABB73B|nr:FABP family protein [Rhodococcus sp. MEB064]
MSSPFDDGRSGSTSPRLSGDEAVARAEDRAKETAGRNIPVLPDLPATDDTANLRLGVDISHSVLALLPLVGVWRGDGEGHDADGDYTFGQQIIVSHDGGPYLTWESRTWRTDAEGAYTAEDLRESGFWRVSGSGIAGAEDEETLELLLTHATGLIELYYGRALTQSSWELATDVVIRTTSAALVGGAKRLYGIVDGGDLAYVEERVGPDGDLAPRLSARLARYVG